VITLPFVGILAIKFACTVLFIRQLAGLSQSRGYSHPGQNIDLENKPDRNNRKHDEYFFHNKPISL
jgi:hypothetical protein